ncbi:MAG: 16S rRNA (cytosine(967)-C(5))-methyltransferase RsmB [Rubrivivax sp.]|nr:16S rRNA (cytosine(967)-C(5))-methyltransferase RsmB [Rubrivivax sp.]
MAHRPQGASSLASAALAADVLSKVLQGRTLSQALEKASLPPTRRGAVLDMAYGALRYRGTLEAVLSQLVKKPLDDAYTRALLLATLYQLAYTQEAPYAVVDNAVKSAPRHLKGLVNAVLRNFTRQREALLAAARQSQVGRSNFPDWWVDRLKQAYPAQHEAILSASQLHPPMTLRLNPGKISPAAYQAELQAAGMTARRTGESALTLDKPLPVEKVPGFADGCVSVQDAGAQWAARLLDVGDGMHVLDACAAPGGKTGHILELADAAVLALDVDEARLARVRQNLDRLGLAAELRTGDAARPQDWWNGRPFDRILADVPCSASGVVRRNPDIKWLRRPQDIAKFARQQAAILDALWQTLAPGGKLLYATCSIFPEENAQQIESFLARHADATWLTLLPELGDGQLLPDDNHDGFYYALLQRAQKITE